MLSMISRLKVEKSRGRSKPTLGLGVFLTMLLLSGLGLGILMGNGTLAGDPTWFSTKNGVGYTLLTVGLGGLLWTAVNWLRRRPISMWMPIQMALLAGLFIPPAATIPSAFAYMVNLGAGWVG